MRFDLAIVGDTPAAWDAALAADRCGMRTVILRPAGVGRERESAVAAFVAALADDAVLPLPGTPGELVARAVERFGRYVSAVRAETGVTVRCGAVRLTGPRSVVVTASEGVETFVADALLIAVGSTARRRHGIPHDGQTVLTPEDLATLSACHGPAAVIGNGPAAVASRRLLAAAGSEVSLIDAEDMVALNRCPGGAVMRRAGQREERFGLVVDAAGRVGATAGLDLAAAGLEPDETGRLWCDADGLTWIEGIAAVGDAVGFPRELRHDPDGPLRAVAALCGDAAGLQSARLLSV